MKTVDLSKEMVEYILDALEEYIGHHDYFEELNLHISELLDTAPEKTETYTFYGITVTVDKEWTPAGDTYFGYFKGSNLAHSQATKEELMLDLNYHCYQESVALRNKQEES